MADENAPVNKPAPSPPVRDESEGCDEDDAGHRQYRAFIQETLEATKKYPLLQGMFLTCEIRPAPPHQGAPGGEEDVCQHAARFCPSIRDPELRRRYDENFYVAAGRNLLQQAMDDARDEAPAPVVVEREERDV